MKREELYLQKNYLKEIITNDFRYIGEIRSIKPINHNDINSKNFLVKCKKSKYVLKFLRNNKKRNYQIHRILNKANLNSADLTSANLFEADLGSANLINVYF